MLGVLYECWTTAMKMWVTLACFVIQAGFVGGGVYLAKKAWDRRGG